MYTRTRVHTHTHTTAHFHRTSFPRILKTSTESVTDQKLLVFCLIEHLHIFLQNIGCTPALMFSICCTKLPFSVVSRNWLRAVTDSATHGLVGASSWAAVMLRTNGSASPWAEVTLAGVLASSVDVDHFIAARSLDLKVNNSSSGSRTLQKGGTPWMDPTTTLRNSASKMKIVRPHVWQTRAWHKTLFPHLNSLPQDTFDDQADSSNRCAQTKFCILFFRLRENWTNGRCSTHQVF